MTPKSRAQLPHLYYPEMNSTRVINSHAFRGGGDSALLTGLEEWWEDANTTGAHASTTLSGSPGTTISGPNSLDAWSLNIGPDESAVLNGLVLPDENYTIAAVARTTGSNRNLIRSDGTEDLIQSRFSAIECRFKVGGSGITDLDAGTTGFGAVILTYDAAGGSGKAWVGPTAGNEMVSADFTAGTTSSTWINFLGTDRWEVATIAVYSRAFTDSDAAEFFNSGSFITYSDL